jgi:hypothetical protein
MLRVPKFKAFGDVQDTTGDQEPSRDTDGPLYSGRDLSAPTGIANDAFGFGSASERGPGPAGDLAASTGAASGAGVALQFATASGPVTPTVVGGGGSSGPFDNISFALNGDAARQQFGVNGAGITIGIISTGFSSTAVNGGGDFSKAVADGLVDPNAVDVHDDNSFTSDEGLAMAEIVHEIAPAAHIVFYSGLPTSGGSGLNAMATAVNVLSTPKGQTVANGLPGAGQQGQGCNIVCDDIFNLSEPFYQPGDLLDQAIDKAVTSGVAYFTLAANAGPTSFYATQGAGTVSFNQSITFNNVTYTTYNFGSANNPSAFELVSIPNTGTTQNPSVANIGLDWEQPWQSISGGNAPQYILQYLLFNDNNGQLGSLAFWGAGDGSNDAVQFGGVTAGNYFLAIAVTSTYGSHIGNGSVGNPGNAVNIPSNENQFKIIFDNNNASVVTVKSASGQADPNAGIGSGTVWGHSEDPNAITVGAVDYLNTPAFNGTLNNEPFSSAGPGKYFFAQNGTLLTSPQSLGKVNISAPDGGATDVNDTSAGGENFSPFIGTSAASPAAAAVAALMLQENPNLTPAKIATILEQTAISFGTPVVAGAGLIDAAAAVKDAAALKAPRIDDFNGDGTSDILWHNTTTGAVETWLMTNAQVTGGTGVGSVSSAWQLLGTGDFNGDATSDILWKNANTGEVDTWLIGNGHLVGGTGVSSVSSAWQVVGTGDYNGDGTSDVLWRNTTTGEVDTWLMNNGHIVGGSAIGMVSSAWQGVVGDFNGDGTSDVIWRNGSTGAVETWLMTNGQVTGGGGVGSASSAWQILGTGDFNGDGTTDILWRNINTGEIDTWLIANGHLVGGTGVSSVSSAWQFVGSGDYNGDGTSDVLWRNTMTGEVDTWLMNNGHIVGGSAIGTVSSAWTTTQGGAAVAGTTAASQAGAQFAGLAGGTAAGGFLGSDGLPINAPSTPITDRIWPSDSSAPGDTPSWPLTRDGSPASDPQVSTARSAASDLLWNANVPIANRLWGADGFATDPAVSTLATGGNSNLHMLSG